MKNWFQSLSVALFVSLFSAVGAQAQQEAPKAEPAADPAPRAVNPAKSALAEARKLYDAVRGLRGGDRIAKLELAAKAFEQVVSLAGEDAKLAALAAFFAAGAWRQQGSLALAERSYLAAAQFDSPRYGARGHLGAADMQRRLKRTDEAIAEYLKVIDLEPGSGAAQDARLWQARLLQVNGKIDEAIATFQSALEAARAGRDTIDTANYLALAWIQKGDFEAAGFVLEHAEEAIAALGEEDPVTQERLRKALEGMSARKALQRALDKKNGAAKDAEQLEEEKRG